MMPIKSDEAEDIIVQYEEGRSLQVPLPAGSIDNYDDDAFDDANAVNIRIIFIILLYIRHCGLLD